jgi:hypothetical protein
MDRKERSGIDRRSGKDRRDAYDLDYFLKGGKERRRWVERRWRKELRKGWIRISRWSSVDLSSCNPKP